MLTFSQITEHIVKSGGKFRLVSKRTGKNLGTYNSKVGAEKRERQVQFFKHQNETANSFDTTNYNDDDDGLQGQIFKRAHFGTPLSPVAESEEKDPGMYSYFSLTHDSAQQLYDWAVMAGIPNPVKPDDMHSTCLYLPKSIPNYFPYQNSFGVDPNTYSFAILRDALVLKYEHPIPRQQWDSAIHWGAEFEFSTYVPHITISYDPENFNFQSERCPLFSIIFNGEHLQSLDKDGLVKESLNSKFKELLTKAKETTQNWVKNGEGREHMTRLARLAVDGPLMNFHPVPDLVYRGESEKSIDHKQAGTSWSKEKKIAKKYASKAKDEDKSVVVKRKISPSTPALDVNKLLNKTLPDKEVFVTYK